MPKPLTNIKTQKYLPTFGQVELENHVVSEEHKKAGALLAPLTSFPHGGAGEKGKGRGRRKGKLDPTRGKVYKGRPNALSSDTMKAQRGRRGLISFGEVNFNSHLETSQNLSFLTGDAQQVDQSPEKAGKG